VKVNMSPLASPSPSPDVNHGKQSWFNAIFKRRPSLDIPSTPLFESPFPPAAASLEAVAVTLPVKKRDSDYSPV
jgi:hypothetical protein